jgi:hypothetical protein
MSAFPRCLPAAAFAVAAAALPTVGYAQAWIKPGEETLLLRLGAVTGNIDTSARLDGDAGTGTPIDLESEGGLSDNLNTFDLAASWRLASRHRIDAQYLQNSRSGSKATERDYTIRDTLIPAGTVLSAEQKTSVGYVGYRYSFMKTPGAEIAAGLGVYGGNFKVRFNADVPTVNIDASTTLPLPVLVLTGDFYLTDRLTMTASLQGLALKIGDVDGKVYRANVAAEYLLTNNFGVGAALDTFDIQADVTKSGFRGNAEVKSTTGRLYLTARF